MFAQLSANARRVLTCRHLLQQAWREKNGGDMRPMRSIVSKLRRTLGDKADAPTQIFTESRVGCQMPKGEAEETMPSD